MARAMTTRGTFGCAEHGQRAAQVGLDRGVGVIPCVTRISSDVISLTSDDIVSIGSRSVKATVEEMVAMSLLMWVIAAILLVAAAMLVAGVGAAGVWIAVIAVGIAVVAIAVVRRRHA
jgi:hypothetical protein